MKNRTFICANNSRQNYLGAAARFMHHRRVNATLQSRDPLLARNLLAPAQMRLSKSPPLKSNFFILEHYRTYIKLYKEYSLYPGLVLEALES